MTVMDTFWLFRGVRYSDANKFSGSVVSGLAFEKQTLEVCYSYVSYSDLVCIVLVFTAWTQIYLWRDAKECLRNFSII